jgi:REP element-mobilizing transposase RayT
MVLATHIIFTAYGFWLPNDPRGSWSDFVRQWELLLFGPATKTTERRSLAHDDHDRKERLDAKNALTYDPVVFSGEQALCISRGFAKAISESRYTVYACSIMPEHVHAVVARHDNPAERIIGHFKARATQALEAAGLHPFVQYRDSKGRFPSVWAHRGWKVFLDSDEDIARAVRYVEENPLKQGLRAQKWSFVTPWFPAL